MTATKRPLKVFLCHAHSDKDAVKALYTRLTKDGVDAWLDKEKLLPGQDWELEIRKAVREVDVVVCLSKQFNQAGFRQKEVRFALDTAMEQLEGDIFIIPARLDECDVPERLQRYHWVDLFDVNEYENLMQSIRLQDDQLEKARIEKEEAVKRHLPFYQTPDTRKNVIQHNIRETTKNKTLHEPAVSDTEGQPARKKSKTTQIKTQYIVAIIGAVATIVARLLSSPLLERWFSPAPIETEVTITPSHTLEPTQVNETPTVTISPTISPTETYTIIPSRTTNSTPTDVPVIVAGTAKSNVTGYLLTAYYNDKSFYVLNKGGAKRSVSGFVFERIDEDGEIQERFEGWQWEKYFATLQPQRCMSLEIYLSPDPYLSPFQCENRVLSTLSLSMDLGNLFWTPDDNSEQFRILWLGEEIARCEIKAGKCDFYVP
ncbi:MAG TPA: TIR domain-containing protein [Anaerolineales bacterium]|nr:TIR domain-containing protein [Anaerolineales bacterium]